MKQRIAELDSLRGLAALVVVICHLLLMTTVFNSSSPKSRIEDLLISSPLSIVWSGHESVILFFVLSGFVLSLPFYGGRQVSYASFIIRRFCRIYLPYIFMIAVALIARTAVHGNLPYMSGWFNRGWSAPITWRNIIDHVIMIGPQFDTNTLDSPIWSLIHEVRIAIVFPLLMYLVNRFGWKINIVIGVALALVGLGFQAVFHASYQPMYKTLPYMLMFIVGALLAKHRAVLVQRIGQTNVLMKTLLLVIAMLSYNTTDWMLHGHLLEVKSLDDLETMTGSTILILLSFSWKGFSKLLLWRPIRFMGKISYSLYLLHVIVLYVMTYLLYGVLPLWAIWCFILGASIALATVTHYFIEVPANELGKYLTTKRSEQVVVAASEGI